MLYIYDNASMISNLVSLGRLFVISLLLTNIAYATNILELYPHASQNFLKAYFGFSIFAK